MMGYSVEVLLVQKAVQAMQLPNLRGWMQRVHERPAYKRALAKGGPVMMPRRPRVAKL